MSRLSLSDVPSDAAPSQLNDTDVRAAGRGRGAKGARGAAVGRSTGRGRGGNPKGGDPSTGEPPAILYAGMCALAQMWASPSVPLVLLCDAHFALLLGSMCRTVYSRTALPSAWFEPRNATAAPTAWLSFAALLSVALPLFGVGLRAPLYSCTVGT